MIILFLLLLSFSLHADEPFHPNYSGNFQIANIAGDPSAIVGGCVNVITGDYFDLQRDLYMVGGQPLVLERSYSSSDHSMGGLSNGWHLNFQGVVNKHTFKGPYGGELTFESNGSIDQESLQKGVTNNSSGCLSGKTNVKNTRLFFKDHKKTCIVRSGDGTHSFFTGSKYNSYKLMSEIKPNGMNLHYQYCVRGLEKVSVSNCSKVLEQSILFAYSDNSSNKPPVELTVYASDCRFVRYGFEMFSYPNHQYSRHLVNLFDEQRYGEPSHKEPREIDTTPPPPTSPEEGEHPRYYLSYVTRPNAPSEKYQYEPKNLENGHLERIVAKVLPDNRYMKITYYKPGQDGPYHLNKSHPWIGKVRSLEGPVGTDGNAITMFRFYYDNVEKGSYEGACRVFNALSHRTDYAWDENKRLKNVIKITNAGNPYLIDTLYWAEGQDLSNLRSRVCSSPEENLFCKCYRYDEHGNVLNEWLYGNLSGHNHAPLLINKDGIPIENGCERIEKSYIYSNEYRNLLLLEREENRSKYYQYVENSDLVKAMYTLVDDRIVLRNFYHYDESCKVAEEITDDGSSQDENDFIGVTYRKIRRMINKKIHPFGVPELIEEFCQLANGPEQLVSVLYNVYSVEGRLIQQDYYDSNRQYQYSLHWEYDAYGNVIKEINALGQEIYKIYDDNGNLTLEQGLDKNFHKKYAYDFSNRLIQMDEVHEKISLSTYYSYDILGRVYSSVDCFGNETNYIYDEFDRVTGIVSPEVEDENGNKIRPYVRKIYDHLGNVVHEINARNGSTFAKYNLRGKPTVIIYPDRSFEHFSYFLNGLLAGKIERNGCSTHYKYDYQNRLIETKYCNPDNKVLWVTSSRYSAFHLLSETDAKGNITEYTYDALGRKTALKQGSRLEEYEYDSMHRIAKHKTYCGENPIIKTFTYDLLNRVIEERIEDASGNIVEQKNFGYDTAGRQNCLIVYGENGAIVQETRYDSHGNPTVIDALGNCTKTTLSYDFIYEGKRVLLQETTDPLGNSTVVIKDALNREIAIIKKNAMGQEIQKRKIFYDLNNNKAKVIETVISSDGDNEITHLWRYDAMNRVIQSVEAFQTPEQKITSYILNRIGQLVETQKPSGVSLYYIYNNDKFLKELLSSDHTIHYTFEYDCFHNMIASCDELTSCTTRRCYDTYGQVVEEQLGNDMTLQFTYDDVGRVETFTLPDSSYVSYTFEGVLLKEIGRYSSTSKKRYSHSYDHYDQSLHPLKQTLLGQAGSLSISRDKKGRISSIRSPHTSETISLDSYDAMDHVSKREIHDALGKNCISYSYDNLYQLIDEKGEESHTYNYDSLYNRIDKDGAKYNYNSLSHITNMGYSYDLDGRLVATPHATFSYDALDRLISVTTEEGKTAYSYDYFNRRITKEMAGTTYRYLYANQNEVGCYREDELMEFRVLGLGHGAEIGATVAIELKGVPYAPIHDIGGNITTLISQTGEVADTYRYTVFGEETTVPTLSNPWKFCSKRCDEESSLVYFGRRYYSPSLGRWMTPDPLCYQAGPNLYAFLLNNPFSDLDLYGLIGENIRETLAETATYVKETIRDCYNRVREYAADLRDTICDTISVAADRIVSTADRIRSSIIEFSDKYLISSKPFPCGGAFFEGAIDGKPTVITCTGQMNTLASSFHTAVTISRFSGGVSIGYVINETTGLIGDTIDSAKMIYAGIIAKDSVYHLRDLIMEGIKTSGEHGVIIHAHSQGAAILHQALEMVQEKFHQYITVYTYGGAKMIAKGKLRKSVNYVSPFDLVPVLADPIGFVKAIFSRNYKVSFLSPKLPFIDHAFLSGPYKSQLEQLGRNFQQGKY